MVFAVVTNHSMEKIEDIPNEQYYATWKTLCTSLLGNCGCFYRKLMEINSNFPGMLIWMYFNHGHWKKKNIKPTFPLGSNCPLCGIFGGCSWVAIYTVYIYINVRTFQHKNSCTITNLCISLSIT